MRLFVCLLALLPLTAVTVNAQYSMPNAPEYTVPASEAVHTEVAPVLDGMVIGDPAYTQAVPISQFWQTTPQEGQPASERTEVRLVYTDRALYVGVICYDREPEAIVVSDTRRDAPLDETDSFQMILDTFLDGQNGRSEERRVGKECRSRWSRYH